MKNSRVVTRKIKNLTNKVINNIRFKIESFSFAKIIILMGVILGYISLFMKWIISENESILSNAFNDITSTSSYIIIFLLSIILFLLFSLNKKEKIKKITNILFRDYIIMIFISIIIIILAINNIGVLVGLKMFISDASYGAGVIILLISQIFTLSGAILLKNDNTSQNNIYLNDSEENTKESSIKNNTKLPF